MTMIRLRGGPFDGQTRRRREVRPDALGRHYEYRPVVVEHRPEDTILRQEAVAYELRRKLTEEYARVYEASRQGDSRAMDRRLELQAHGRAFEEWLEYVGVEP